ncbi:hypothetical protein FB451DRAFT_1128071 [Mycena latifolia]|nr:hypothetical protein FB451DRAFT_1128071 [Mycena latifolia]
MVFRHALPPPWVLTGEPSFPPFPQSIWSTDLRIKLVIIRVCKTWHQIGLELLYRSVTLRRIGQMPAFVCALEACQTLGALVRDLHVTCFVPHGYHALYMQETQKILLLCPRLSHFGFKPSFLIPGAPALLPALGGTNITSLEYSNNVEYSLILPTLVQLCGSLRFLALPLPSIHHASHPTIVFSQLEYLHLHLHNSATSRPTWLMPVLQRLWLLNLSTDSKSIQTAEAFLSVHGHTIKFLWVADFIPSSETDPTIQGVLDRCPVLEHLATSVRVHGRRRTPLTHKKIKSLDMFEGPRKKSSSFYKGAFKRLPALCTVRSLDRSMRLLWDIPPDIPHHIEALWLIGDGVKDDEPTQSVWITAALAIDPSEAVFIEECVDDSDGDDTDPDSGSSSDSDSDTSCSCITVSDHEDDASMAVEFYLEENREFSHDEALAIFRGIHPS